MKKTYSHGDNISELLRILQKTDADQWNPRLQISAATDADDKHREDREFELIHKVQLDKAMKRKREHTNSLFKA